MAIEVAKGIQDHPEFKLGSKVGAGKSNPKTLKLTTFMGTKISRPASFDFDKSRKPFAKHMWGNDAYGDCEIAGRANYMLRLQRAQTKTTPEIDDNDVISEYKVMTGCVNAGDNNDTGLTTLDNLSKWKAGWSIEKKWRQGGHAIRNYHISAYGLVDENNPVQVRDAIYLFQGILLGVDMPITAQEGTRKGVWDYEPGSGSDAYPGSWGGHCVYAKKYDKDNIYVLTWGKEIKVTQSFFDRYVMEVYSVIDSFATWFKFPHVLNVDGLIKQMESAGIKVTK